MLTSQTVICYLMCNKECHIVLTLQSDDNRKQKIRELVTEIRNTSIAKKRTTRNSTMKRAASYPNDSKVSKCF